MITHVIAKKGFLMMIQINVQLVIKIVQHVRNLMIIVVNVKINFT